MSGGSEGSWAWCAVALGSNLGEREAHLRAGVEAILATAGVRDGRVSAVHETDPVGPVEQGPFLNAAMTFETTLSARALLDRLHEIERGRGRDRSGERRWGPRTLDLDLILYGDALIDEPGLTVPHPRLAERRFVLEPLAEIDPDAVVPGLGQTIAELLAGARAAG